jgi:hypothetical protein
MKGLNKKSDNHKDVSPSEVLDYVQTHQNAEKDKKYE